MAKSPGGHSESNVDLSLRTHVFIRSETGGPTTQDRRHDPTEFQRLPVAAGSVTAQPSPHTLRGAETNFFAEAAQQQFDITILAQKVHVVAKPVQYTWNYGDGSSLGPQTAAGGPLPQDRWGEKTATSHVYTADRRFPSGADHPLPGDLFGQRRPAVAHPGPRAIQLTAADRQRLALHHTELC